MMKLEYMYVFQRRDSMKSFIKIALAAGGYCTFLHLYSFGSTDSRFSGGRDCSARWLLYTV